MDRMSSIEFAIKNEETEKDFYLGEAKRTRNQVARLLFETLAYDEQEHMTRIRALHTKLAADDQWPENIPIEVAGTDIKKRLNELVRKVETTVEHDGDDIAALKRGAEFEAKGAMFYSELAKKCKNPQEIRFFKFLASIEKEHMASIKDSLFYLEDPEGWTAQRERSGLDGA